MRYQVPSSSHTGCPDLQSWKTPTYSGWKLRYVFTLRSRSAKHAVPLRLRNIPVSTSTVGIDVDDTNAIWTVFPNQAVWVWPVRDVLCHKRHGDHHFLDIVNGAFNLKVKRWNTVLLLLLHGFFVVAFLIVESTHVWTFAKGINDWWTCLFVWFKGKSLRQSPRIAHLSRELSFLAAKTRLT